MNLDLVRVFVDVARLGGFAAVARERDVDPSSVSRAVADLEDRVGARLFQRSTRKLSLTEAGVLYLARVEPLLDGFDEAGQAARDAGGAARGLLRVSASVTFGQAMIVPLLPKFRALHPGVSFEGVFTDTNLDLVGERIDLAVRLAPAVEGDLVASKLMDTRYRVVASPHYLRAAGALARPGDLSSHRCLLFSLPVYRTRWLFRDRTGAIEEVRVAGDVTLSPAGSLREAAIAGLGPALLPDWLVSDALARGGLVDPFPDHAVTATTFDTAAWLVYPSRAYLPAKVRAMIDLLRSELGERSRPSHPAP